jgi:hypothetical protein
MIVSDTSRSCGSVSDTSCVHQQVAKLLLFQQNNANSLSLPWVAQVAERSLFLWNNEYIVSMVAQQRATVLPIVFAALERNARSHWNPAVHGLTCNVRKMFQDMDEPLWEKCRQQYDAVEVRFPLPCKLHFPLHSQKW